MDDESDPAFAVMLAEQPSKTVEQAIEVAKKHVAAVREWINLVTEM